MKQTKKQSEKDEVRLVVIAVVVALMSIFAHLILSKHFSEVAWVEYTAAAIPFAMLALCVFAFKYAQKADRRKDQNTD